MHCFSSIETAVDLPTPVEPTSAKWREVSSLMLTVAAIAAFYAMSNRFANAMGVRPNDEFYAMGR